MVVRIGDTDVVPTAPKQRTVLAMLAIHSNEPVQVESLVTELWQNARPANARATVQTYVMQLRKVIATAEPRAAGRDGEPARRDRLVTVPGGYQLLAASDSVDARRFDQFATSGHRARERGDLKLAAEQFRIALDCWSGPALADVRFGPDLALNVKRLEEARFNALECRIEVDIKLGRHHELLGELAALAARHPTHERLAAHLMVALYYTGRRLDALEVYRRHQEELAEQYGLSPSPHLGRLQQAMISAELDPADAVNLIPPQAGRRWRPAADPGASQPGGNGRRISAALACVEWQAKGYTS